SSTVVACSAMTLKQTISELADNFAKGILQAIRGASLEEILGESGRKGPVRETQATGAAGAASSTPKRRGRPGRLARRSSEDIEKVVKMVIEALSSAAAGMRSEELQKALKVFKQEITRPLT